jgi:hypothetical protein
MKSLLFTAILSLRKRSEQILIKFAILLQVRLTHAQTFFRGVHVTKFIFQRMVDFNVGGLCGYHFFYSISLLFVSLIFVILAMTVV